MKGDIEQLEKEGMYRTDWIRLFRRRRDIYRIRELEYEVRHLEGRVRDLERDAREGASIRSTHELSESVYGTMINQMGLELDRLRESSTD